MNLWQRNRDQVPFRHKILSFSLTLSPYTFSILILNKYYDQQHRHWTGYKSHHTKKGNPLRVHVKIWRLWKTSSNFAWYLFQVSRSFEEFAYIMRKGKYCKFISVAWRPALLRNRQRGSFYMRVVLLRTPRVLGKLRYFHWVRTVQTSLCAIFLRQKSWSSMTALQSLYGETLCWKLWKRQEILSVYVACMHMYFYRKFQWKGETFKR